MLNMYIADYRYSMS